MSRRHMPGTGRCSLGHAEENLPLRLVQMEKFLKHQCFMDVGVALLFKQVLSLA